MKAQKKQTLPEWNLADLYQHIKDPKIAKDLDNAEKLCLALKKNYAGKIPKLSGAQLAKAIAEYEVIQDVLGGLGSYAALIFAKNMMLPENTQFYQNIQEKMTTLTSQILFFTLDLNKISEPALKKLMTTAALKKYAPWLRDIRAFKSYQLSDDLERLLLEKSVSGRSAWTRLFDETIGSLKFPYQGKELSEPEIFEYLSNSDGKVRESAAKVVGSVFKQHAPVFTLITNTLAKDKEIEDQWRRFKRPISSRNLSNCIEDEVVDALLSAVKASYPKLSHRYYAKKAKWLGKKKLEYWDRNAPLPGDDDKRYVWNEARDLVLDSYASFSPTLAKQGRIFFDNPWIDAAVTPGKSPGAFAHPTVPSAHPYLLVNFMGRSRDVMTLAHELGHGVHQVLSARQGALMCDTPLTLAETASVFGEQLTFQEMLRREKNAERRHRLLASKVEDMLNTVVRQIAFCEFERQLHDARKKSELTTQQISDIWLAVQRESLGPSLNLSGDYQYFWSYIPHFIHSPFYVYAYAFGDCLVNSLYAVYQGGKVKDFEKKYLSMLEAGGTLRHKELLKPFGLDASKPAFWSQGLRIIEDLIDEL